MKENLDIEFSEEEKKLIEDALTKIKPWNDEKTKDVRNKIHSFHLALKKKFCCYCQQNFHGEFKLVIDPEHILPASVYPHYSYSIWNLSVACKRCNMLIKKARTDFLNTNHANEQESEHYFLVHPNFDSYNQHLKKCMVQEGDEILVKYRIISTDKGDYTFRYFRLSELEIDSFNSAQGIQTAPQDSEAALEVRALALRNNIQ